MRLDGRRESTNVDDRRGRGGGFRLGGKGGLGIGAAIIIGLLTYFMTGDLGTAFQAASQGTDLTEMVGGQAADQQDAAYEPTPEEKEL